jgi:3(or 17)beta-hydroxysteroid dehydrogenase
MRVSEKVALVTGAAQGIGEAIARTLSREGAFVYACDIAGTALSAVVGDIDAKGGKAVAVFHDVASQDSWLKVAKMVQERHGKLDILVNNAGIEMAKALSDLSLDEWRKVQSINVESVFLGCRESKDLLIAASKLSGNTSSIINISSIAGLVGFANQPAYNTSKAAVRHLSKSLAIEFGSENVNIRVNAVLPGAINTPMLMETIGALEQEAFVQAVPLRSIGDPYDIANAVLYLASEESSYVTGTELIVDGGVTAK